MCSYATMAMRERRFLRFPSDGFLSDLQRICVVFLVTQNKRGLSLRVEGGFSRQTSTEAFNERREKYEINQKNYCISIDL